MDTNRRHLMVLGVLTRYSLHAGAVADDFYHLYPIDIAAMQLLGVKRFRFSISWPRIIPDGDGPVNQKGLDFYARLLDAMHAAGIEPLVCLYHWDLPEVSCLVHVPALESILMLSKLMHALESS